MKREKYNAPNGCADQAIAIFVMMPLLPLYVFLILLLKAISKISYCVYWCYDFLSEKMSEYE